MFADIQRDYHRTKEEYNEVVRAAAMYLEELHNKKDELKGASEVVASCKQSMLSLENEKEYADLERNRVKANLEQAKATLQEKERALLAATREQDALKAEVAAKVAKARVDAIQVYKNSFKDTVDYLYLMRDVVNQYKESIKKVDPTFDGDYYDSLISGEPLTPAPEELVETPADEVEQDVVPLAEHEQDKVSDKQPVESAQQPANAHPAPPASF